MNKALINRLLLIASVGLAIGGLLLVALNLPGSSGKMGDLTLGVLFIALAGLFWLIRATHKSNKK